LVAAAPRIAMVFATKPGPPVLPSAGDDQYDDSSMPMPAHAPVIPGCTGVVEPCGA
jgi:hypothetical protein